jgi:hypothetical protein
MIFSFLCSVLMQEDELPTYEPFNLTWKKPVLVVFEIDTGTQGGADSILEADGGNGLYSS